MGNEYAFFNFYSYCEFIPDYRMLFPDNGGLSVPFKYIYNFFPDNGVLNALFNLEYPHTGTGKGQTDLLHPWRE